MKILVIGNLGKMGKELSNFLHGKNEEVVGVDINNKNTFKTENVDIVVDFSSQTALKENLNLALSLNAPIVIATTGHTQKNLNLIKNTAKKLPIFMSSNFSLGFFAVTKSLSIFKNLKDYDFNIIETHHKQKKDIPSGSALTLKNVLSKTNINANITSLRAGSVFGEHKILIYGENETIEIKHTALNRKLFCEGVLVACKFLIKQVNGLYNMENLYNDSL